MDSPRLPSSPPPFFLQGAAEAWTVFSPGWVSHRLGGFLYVRGQQNDDRGGGGGSLCLLGLQLYSLPAVSVLFLLPERS